MPAEVPAGRRAVYQFIRPRRSIKQELLAQRWSGSSSADHSDVILKPSLSRESQNLWQKANSLRQSLRVKGSSRKSSSSDSKFTSSLPASESQRPCRPERKTNNKPSKNDIICWDGCRNNNGNHHDEVPTSDGDVTVVVSRHVRSHSDYSGLGTELFAGDRLRHPSTVSTLSSVTSQKEMVFQSSSEHLVLPRHQRSPRKLTKDSGYETSAQGEPDYVNADWVNEGEGEGREKTTPLPSPDTCGQKKNGAFAHFRTSSFSGDERLEKYIQQPSQPSRYLHGHQSCNKESGRHHHQQQHHLYSRGGTNRSFSCYSSSESLCLPPPVTATPVARRPELCNNRYSSSESLTSWSSSRAGSLLLATKSSPSLVNKEKRSLPPPPLPPPYQSSAWYSSSPSVSPARSTPNLEQEAADMVTRRFTKKRSVYEALANKSGLDFAPVIHRQPYWERREIFEDDSSSCRQPGRFHGNHLYGVSQDEGPRSLPECGVKNLTKDDSERHLFSSRDSSQNGQSQPTESMSSAQGSMSYVNKSSACHKDERPLSPPSIPTRDSSLRYRASSAHEKYPSWPVTSPGAVEIGSQVNSSSQRSNSWTEQTDYTKESHVPYSRPKKMYQISTHQLHPVQEKAGEGANKNSPKIEPESLPRRHLHTEPSTTGGLTADSIAQYFDFDYQKNHSQRCRGDREYNTHSPPERDTSVCSARDDNNSNSFDDDPYIKKYEDMLRYYSQSPALYGNWNREHHQMTVADSTTPLLDRLRMESESLPSVWPPSQELDTPSEAGTCAESVDSNSSSQETLKWHGSYSDLSILSVQASNRSLQFDSGHSTLADSGRLTPQSMSGTVSPDCSSRAHVVARQGHQPESLVRSARVEQPQRHDSESISYCVSGLKRNHKTHDIGELSDSPTSQQSSLMNTSPKHHSSSDLTPSHDNRMNYSNKDIRNPGTISQAFSTTFPGFSRNAYNSEGHTLSHEMCPVIKPNLSLSSSEVSPSISKAKIGASDLSSAYRDKLANKIQTSLSSSSISDVKESYNPLYSAKCWSRQRSEDNNQKTIYDQKHTKKHRISDPELKAIQKQAVLSFYHRQTALACAEASSDAKSDRCNHNSYSPHFQSTIQENLEGESSSVANLISPSRSTKLPFSKSSVGSQQQHYPDTEERPSKPVPRISDASESDASVSSPHRRDATSPPESLKFSFEAKPSLGAASSSSQQSLISEHGELQRISPGRWSEGYSVALREEGIKTSPNQSAHSSSDLKDRTDRASSSGSLWPHSAGRKAQLKKIYSSNETAVVKVISSEGVTLVETVEAPEARKNVSSVKPQVPPKRINKPLPPPPLSAAAASRPPAPPPPPPSSASEPIPPLPDPEEDEELREIEDSIQNHLKVAPLLFGSTCSSPDLPLPPPPANTDTEVLQTDDPLPPPPPDTQDVELSVASEDHGTAETHPVSSCLTYQRESGPAGDHARLATASESPPLVQTDAAPQPPISNCNGHITEMTYENVPSAKSSRLLQSPAREDSPRQTFASSAQQQIFLPTSEASLETVPARSPQRDGAEDEVEALYANLDLLQLRIQNGDHYGLLSNGCEISPPAIVSVTNSATQTTDTPRLTRKKNSASKSHAELECERLSRDFVNHFGDTTLRNLLLPAPNHKTMSDYMEGLLDLELEKGGKPTARSVLSNRTVRDQASQPTPPANDRRDNVGLPLTSAYFTTSEPKAKLLTRYCHSLDRHDWANEIELGGKKEELIASIGKKLDIMRLEQVALQEEMNQNEQLGREVTAKVEQLAKPNELEKYRLHVEELEKIINLLLSLSGRLARAQNAFLILPKDAREEERCILEAKRDKLSEQHEEARRLKESIDRRSYQVSTFLHHYLSKDEYADYDHFIKMKSKLLMDAREIDEKIKLGEEQLAALRSSMDPHLWNGAKIDLQSNAHTVVNRT